MFATYARIALQQTSDLVRLRVADDYVKAGKGFDWDLTSNIEDAYVFNMAELGSRLLIKLIQRKHYCDAEIWREP